jgi:hypothetical protein
MRSISRGVPGGTLAMKTTYSQVGNLENTTSLLSLFYAGFIGIAVVLITDY